MTVERESESCGLFRELRKCLKAAPSISCETASPMETRRKVSGKLPCGSDRHAEHSRLGARILRTEKGAETFTFGLFHGFGFAGALADIGLPQTEIPLALACFNVGVE